MFQDGLGINHFLFAVFARFHSRMACALQCLGVKVLEIKGWQVWAGVDV